MSWSDERVETLKRMWGEGQSASQIAKELGGVTRNAVIGKVHRLGLSNRNGGAGAASAAQAEPAEAEAPKSAPKPAAKPASKPAAKPASSKPAAKLEPETSEEEDEDDAPAAPVTRIKPIIPAGQPLPPQPSTNEIDPKALAKVSEVEKKAKKLSLMELTSRTCKWPVGDPATDDFWFCGLPTQAGKPYCEAHVGVAFQPMSSRRDRRR
ncbi:GcrA family cell cycle regulator [Roseovarius aquimarinus]|uniref:GcrA family cell cycle regulator n=1 Tax=Roseovarius aquimarinus TaxID=1229156 RepID=A0ABW7I2B6_9RHOB